MKVMTEYFHINNIIIDRTNLSNTSQSDDLIMDFCYYEGKFIFSCIDNTNYTCSMPLYLAI